MEKENRRSIAGKLAQRRILQSLGARISAISGVYSLKDRGLLEDELNEILSKLEGCGGPKVEARITSEHSRLMLIQFYDSEGYPVNIDATRGELHRLN